jgi:hypothetical protein
MRQQPVFRLPGGAGGVRTLYLFNAIEALSQMSYSPAVVNYTMLRPLLPPLS